MPNSAARSSSVTLRKPWLKKCARAASTMRARLESFDDRRRASARIFPNDLVVCVFLIGAGAIYGCRMFDFTLETKLVYTVSKHLQQNFPTLGSGIMAFVRGERP